MSLHVVLAKRVVYTSLMSTPHVNEFRSESLSPKFEFVADSGLSISGISGLWDQHSKWIRSSFGTFVPRIQFVIFPQPRPKNFVRLELHGQYRVSFGAEFQRSCRQVKTILILSN